MHPAHPAEGLDFGPVPLGAYSSRSVTIASCGTAPLTIRRVRLGPGTDDALRLARESVPALPAVLPAPKAGEAPPAVDIELRCAPDDVATFRGSVVVESDDPARAEAILPATCQGVPNQCPVPVVAEDTFSVHLYDFVRLDASPSSDAESPQSRPVEYRWSVIEAPFGSSAHPIEQAGRDEQAPYDGAVNDDPSTPTAVVFVDVVGTYTFELFVKDSLDLEAPSDACPAPRALVTVVVTD